MAESLDIEHNNLLSGTRRLTETRQAYWAIGARHALFFLFGDARISTEVRDRLGKILKLEGSGGANRKAGVEPFCAVVCRRRAGDYASADTPFRKFAVASNLFDDRAVAFRPDRWRSMP